MVLAIKGRLNILLTNMQFNNNYRFSKNFERYLDKLSEKIENVAKTDKDLLSQKIDFSKDFLIEKLIVKNSRNLILGYWGQGKTWLALYLAKQIAYGERVGDFKVMENCNVIYINPEENDSSLIYKLQKLNVPPGGKIYFMSDKIETPHDADVLYKKAEEINAKVIFFDTLRKVSNFKENYSEEASEFFGWIKKYLNNNGITTIFTHHRAKRGSLTTLPEDIPEASLGRGSSEIMADADSILLVKKKFMPESASEDTLILEVKQEKLRLGREVGSLNFEFKFPDVYITPFSEAETKKERLLEYVKTRIQKDGEIERFEVIEFANSVGISKWTVQAYMDEAVDNQLFSKIKKGRRIVYTFGPEMEINKNNDEEIF